MVTWANLPQGNEVSSRLLGGNGGGRIRPPLTQAGRGISPRSLQPNPFPPPPARSARRNQRSAEGVARPPCLPQGLGFLSVPASLPPPSSPESRNRPTWGGAEGRGGCHPMGSGLAAKRRGSRGRRRARSAHLIREAACGGPLAPPEFRSRAQPERWRAPTCPPPRVLQSTPPRAPWTSQAQKDTRRGALRSLPSLPPPERRRSGRLPSGCNVTQPRRRRLPCSSAGRDTSRGRSSGRSVPDFEPLCPDRGTESPGPVWPAGVCRLPPSGNFGGAVWDPHPEMEERERD